MSLVTAPSYDQTTDRDIKSSVMAFIDTVDVMIIRLFADQLVLRPIEARPFENVVVLQRYKVQDTV
ncbi:MAG: hypothetical protein R3E44_07645 [Paracoccaceae bacterium]